jgi:hypothetical protein
MSTPIDSNETNGQHEGNLGRHKAQCSICNSSYLNEIEESWLNWSSPAKIEYDFRVSRHSLYRHCHAFNLFTKRRQNLLMAYERIAERADTIQFSGSNVLTALGVVSKLMEAQKAAERVPSAEHEAAVRQIVEKDEENSVVNLCPPVAEMPGAEPGQGDDGKLEAQNPETSTVQ